MFVTYYELFSFCTNDLLIPYVDFSNCSILSIKLSNCAFVLTKYLVVSLFSVDSFVDWLLEADVFSFSIKFHAFVWFKYRLSLKPKHHPLVFPRIKMIKSGICNKLYPSTNPMYPPIFPIRTWMSMALCIKQQTSRAFAIYISLKCIYFISKI